VAALLDMSIERIHYPLPDTDYVPDSGPTVASRTMMIVGGLVARATKKLKETWISGISQTVEAAYEQPEYIEWDEAKMQGDAYPAYSWGVNVVEVEVDKNTYQVTPKYVWSVYDLGKAIDERIVLGQADGGLAQGLAYGYMEVMETAAGKIKQKNLTDYIIPTAADMPPTKTYIFDNPYAYGPYGAKGVGELTLDGAAPAIAQAIEMAINRKVTKIPVTPEYIMELMRDGEN
ncbi:MAG: xanthine dehydrogenase family protein molybdopterin-binding subunit, partial [Bacilli bacterium]|nr:xanthine dehydrogenase family protein molybdopterin-binding subunit [Bacilli bacterium]